MDWLCEQYKRLEEEKLRQEQQIRNLHSLFRPWPPKNSSVGATESSQECVRNTGPENGGANLEANLAPTLTAEEKESLDMMNKLLSKAQKARDVQKRLAEPKRTKSKEIVKKEDIKESSQSKANDKIKPVKEDISYIDSLKGDNSGLKPVKGVISDLKMKTENSGRVNKPVKQLRASSGLPQETMSSTQVLEKSQKARASERPKSSSGQRKVVPAHVSAPFQTNARLTSSKLQTTYGAATAKSFTKSRSSKNSADSLKRNKEIKCASRNDAIVDASKSERYQKDFIGASTDVNAKCDKEEDNVSDSKCMKSQEADKEETSCNDNFEPVANFKKLSIGSSEKCESQTKEMEGPMMFDLAKDGTSLTVPGKLKKLMYQNKKLHEKLYTQNVTQKVDSPQTITSFPQQLDLMCGSEDAQLVQSQMRQAQHILQTYTSLTELLSSLHMDQISAESHAADVYRAKKMMEYILVTFQEMEEKLHTSDFSALGTAVLYPGDKPHVPVLVGPRRPAVWYDKHSVTVPSCQASAFKYGSYRELERYMNSLFKVQLLQLQCDVIETMSKSVMPLLQSLDPCSSEFAQVLRIGYSLLSVDANHMPVVVKDTIQDVSIQQIEQQQ